MSNYHLYWFTYDADDVPSVRFRCTQFLAHLQSVHGVKSSVIQPPTCFRKQLVFLMLVTKLAFSRKKKSKVVIQQVGANDFYARVLLLLSKWRKDVIYDVDSSINHLIEDSVFLSFLQSSEVIMCGSKWMKKFVQNAGSKSFFLPTPAQTNREIGPLSELFTIGWIADARLDHSHDECLSNINQLETALLPIVRAISFPVKLEIIGIKEAKDRNRIRQALAGFPTIILEMPEVGLSDEELLFKQISSWDLGISLSNEHIWSITAGPIWNQHLLSCGVPLLVSNLGENSALIEHGVNGWKCDSKDDFVDAVNRYSMLSPQQKQELKKAAKHSVESWNIESVGSRFVEWVIQE